MSLWVLFLIALVAFIAWLAWAAYRAPELPASDERGWSDREIRNRWEGSE